jgi:hypothetical protein
MERCREIARRIDAGDIAVLGEQEDFISQHGAQIWDLKSAQQAKRRAAKAVSAPEPGDDVDRDEDLLDPDGQCACQCEECLDGRCAECSDPDCTDLNCVHDPDRDLDEDEKENDFDEADED